MGNSFWGNKYSKPYLKSQNESSQGMKALRHQLYNPQYNIHISSRLSKLWLISLDLIGVPYFKEPKVSVIIYGIWMWTRLLRNVTSSKSSSWLLQASKNYKMNISPSFQNWTASNTQVVLKVSRQRVWKGGKCI